MALKHILFLCSASRPSLLISQHKLLFLPHKLLSDMQKFFFLFFLLFRFNFVGKLLSVLQRKQKFKASLTMLQQESLSSFQDSEEHF